MTIRNEGLNSQVISNAMHWASGDKTRKIVLTISKDVVKVSVHSNFTIITLPDNYLGNINTYLCEDEKDRAQRLYDMAKKDLIKITGVVCEEDL